MSDFRAQDLVRYVPNHANGDRHHKDCETGVVTSVGASGTVFVLFNGSTPQGCYPDSLVLLARIERMACGHTSPAQCDINCAQARTLGEYTIEKTCARGHRWLISKREHDAYKGGTFCCPICAREGLREPSR